MKNKLMILGASILQLPAIEQAAEMGLQVIAVDMNPEAVGFRVPGVTREVISTIDIPAIVEAAKRHRIDGIMTLATDMPMRSVAAVAEAIGLVGISPETAVKATNKAEMRKALKAANVPVPAFFKVSDMAQYKAAAGQFSGPFVVKTADSSGSRGIYLVKVITDTEDIERAYRHSRPHSRSGDVVVEEYMTGPEVSVETLTVNGVCHVIQITDKITTGAPHFVEMGHTQPSRLADPVKMQIAEVAKAANRAIGIENGPSHTEIIVTEEGPKIVELGARLGGDCITTHLVPLSTGVNMVQCCIRIALGQTPDIVPKCSKVSAIRYFSQRSGVVKSIAGVEEARKIPGVKQISIVHGVGEAVTEITSSGDRMGFAVVQADSMDQATAAFAQVNSTVAIDIE